MAQPVLVISIDGLAPRFVTPRVMPTLCSLARAGASCFSARTVDPPLTVPAHASMFRGVAPGSHGLVDNSPLAPRCNAPSILAAARAAGLTTASVICWPPMDQLIEPQASTYRVSLDSGYDPHDDDVVTGETIDLLRGHRPDVTITYLVGTDLAGHGVGWGTEEYIAAASRIDALLADLVHAAGPESAIVVTTDHGGVGRGHFEAVDDVLETFVIVRSPRTRPGSMWTQASILDIAPTVADLAGVDPAHDWTGRSLVGTEQPIVDHLVALVAAMAEHTYGERVDMLQHSLQTAARARAAGASAALTVAALLHDIGHVIGHDRAGAWGLPDHAEVGARYLQQWLPADVVEPIRRHVAAKRYLVATDPMYRDQLSEASIESLREQGGPFTTEEALTFELAPFAAEATQLRRHDDDGKIDGLDVPGLEDYRMLLAGLLTTG